MPDFAKVAAITAASSLSPLPGLPAKAPTAKGQIGYMELGAARTAQTAGAVVVLVDHTPQMVEHLIGGELGHGGSFPAVPPPPPPPPSGSDDEVCP